MLIKYSLHAQFCPWAERRFLSPFDPTFETSVFFLVYRFLLAEMLCTCVRILGSRDFVFSWNLHPKHSWQCDWSLVMCELTENVSAPWIGITLFHGAKYHITRSIRSSSFIGPLHFSVQWFKRHIRQAAGSETDGRFKLKPVRGSICGTLLKQYSFKKFTGKRWGGLFGFSWSSGVFNFWDAANSAADIEGSLYLSTEMWILFFPFFKLSTTAGVGVENKGRVFVAKYTDSGETVARGLALVL